MAVSPLEYQVLSAIRDRSTYTRNLHLLKENLFESAQTRFLFRIITEYHNNRESTTLTLRALKMLLRSEVKQEEQSKFRGVIKKLSRSTIKDKTVVDELIKKFAKVQNVKHAVHMMLDVIDKDPEADLERVRQKIDQAISSDLKDPHESYEYFKTMYKRMHEESNEGRIGTKISVDLDTALTGGLAPGEVGIVIAPTSVGKTLTLVNIGYGALLQGKKVAYITLEISQRKVGRRFDTRIARMPYKDIKDKPEVLAKKFKLLTQRGANLKIKQFISELCSVNDVRAWLNHLKSKKQGFDMVIIDYVDVMHSQRQYAEKRHELGGIVASIRRVANEFQVPIWTASQANRHAGAKGKTKLWDIAESIEKAHWADLAFTLSQTDEEKEEGYLWLAIAKTRMDGKNPKYLIQVDYDTMVMKGPKGDLQEMKEASRDRD